MSDRPNTYGSNSVPNLQRVVSSSITNGNVTVNVEGANGSVDGPLRSILRRPVAVTYNTVRVRVICLSIESHSCMFGVSIILERNGIEETRLVSLRRLLDILSHYYTYNENLI